MLTLIFGTKSGSGDDLGQYDTKTIILCPLYGQTPLRNNVVMATPKVPGDQKLFERVCYKSKSSDTVSASYTRRFLSCIKKPSWGGGGGRGQIPPQKK